MRGGIWGLPGQGGVEPHPPDDLSDSIIGATARQCLAWHEAIQLGIDAAPIALPVLQASHIK